MTNCPCGGSCACHANPVFPPPCDVPGGCGLTTFEPDQPAPQCAAEYCTASPDPVLCPGHARQLGDRLASIGARYGALTAVPSIQAPAAGIISGGTLASHRSVGLLHVMAIRDRRTPADPDSRLRSVFSVLAAWAGQVRDERKIKRPTRQLTARLGDAPAGPICDHWCTHATCAAWTFRAIGLVPRTVATERKLLATQLPWILEQDWAGDFHTEIDELWGLLLSAGPPAGTSADRRVPCPACGFEARWSGGAVTCAACGHAASGLAVIRRNASAA